MDEDQSKDTVGTEPAAPKPPRPRASAWLWRPFHAKAWWAAMVVYWGGAAISLKVEVLAGFYTSALAGFLNVIFYPLVALMILGLGYLRAWFAWSDWEWVEPSHDQMFPNQSRGGLRDPYSDPLDPRSTLYWSRRDNA